MALAPVSKLQLVSRELGAELRSLLAKAGFDESALAAAERIAPGQFDPVRLPLVHWHLGRQGTAAATLTRFFLYGGALSPDALAALLGRRLTAALSQAQWFSEAADGLRAAFRLIPFEGLWLLHDEPSAGPEAVMGPGPTTLRLVRWLPDPRGRSFLDVGCGAGTLALVAAARGAGRVVGTDISERAIEVARCNARLNGLEAEFRVGSLLEPVRGERFEQLAAQPPYVMRPPGLAPVTFLHGGAHGDELAMALIAGLPGALEPTGEAMLLFDSAVRREPLADRVRAALGGAPLDVVLLTAKGAGADLQAIAYASVGAPGFGAEYEASVRRYREHLEALSVTEFSQALLVARPFAGPSPRFTVALPVQSLATPTPGTLDRRFAALELAALTDDELLAKALRPAPGLTWLEERPLPDSSLQPRFKVLFPEGELGADQQLSEASYVLVGALAAAPAVAAAVAAYAEACGATVDEVQSQVLGFVRQGLATGLLTSAPG